MVAYNLALALFPFALLVLFIFGQVIQNPDVEASVLRDLQSIFPAAEESSLTSVVDRIRDSSTTIGVVAAIGAIWIGASFWGAMDTAFCRIYHVECRGWVEQKRFALLMLLVVVAFLAASVMIPVAEGVLASGAEDLPFGLDQIGGLRSAARAGGRADAHLRALRADLLRRCPRATCPGAGSGPGRCSSPRRRRSPTRPSPSTSPSPTSTQLGGALGFILVALVWFYLISLALLAGAVINALRFEFHETGSVEEERARAFAEPRRRSRVLAASSSAARIAAAERRRLDLEQLHARSVGDDRLGRQALDQRPGDADVDRGDQPDPQRGEPRRQQRHRDPQRRAPVQRRGHRLHHPAVGRHLRAADLDLAARRLPGSRARRAGSATTSAIAIGCVRVETHRGVTIAGRRLTR